MIYEIINIGKGLIESLTPANLLLVKDSNIVVTDGVVSAPNATIKNIINDKDLITKEYLAQTVYEIPSVFIYVEKTISEMHSLIEFNSLIPGTLYKISGVHPTLYNDGTNSGTTIYLTALTTNVLSKSGHGEFWNPKYNRNYIEVPGELFGTVRLPNLGLWHNRSSWTVKKTNSFMPNEFTLPIHQFGSSVFGNTASNPSKMIIDSLGNIYTANRESNNVNKITPGGVVTILGTTGIEPVGITIDSLGNIYTANYGSHNVSKITPGGVSTILGTTSNYPVGIIIDSQGNVYTSNQFSHNVTKITPEGVSTLFAATEQYPMELVMDSLGNIYTVNNNYSGTITKITPEGVATVFATVGSYPKSISIDSLGNLYTADSNSSSVTKVTPAGVVSTIVINSHVDSLIIDSSDNVYIIGEYSREVRKINAGGTSSNLLYNLEINNPKDIVIDASGNIYVSHSYHNKVYKIYSLYDPVAPTLVDTTSFNFLPSENITANNGATGKLFAVLESKLFITTSTGWDTATSIIGDSSKASANVSGIQLKSYAIGEKVFWGGYSWTNIMGYLGDKVDILTLNFEWEKNEYSINDYTKVIDIIEYDIIHDWITRRVEVQAGNDIQYNYADSYEAGWSHSSISVFMFGNILDENTGFGTWGNKVKNGGYLECVDFYGRTVGLNDLDSYGFIQDNYFVNRSGLDGNVLSNWSGIYSNTSLTFGIGYNIMSDSSRINDNTCLSNGTYGNIITDSSISNNVIYKFGSINVNRLINGTQIDNNIFLEGSTFYRNDFDYGKLTQNVFKSGWMEGNVFTKVSSVNNCNFKGCSFIGNILDNNSSIINFISTDEDGAEFHYNKLNASNITSLSLGARGKFNKNVMNNSTLTLALTPSISFKTLEALTMNKATIAGDISSSTILFTEFTKDAYSRPDGTTKLKYFNDFDTLVIADITD